MLSLPVLKEASGICRSQRYADVYYVHNDSGNKPVLYAVNGAGDAMDFSLVPSGVRAADVEDCSGATVDGVPLLVMADVGDNFCKRAVYKFIVLEEPRGATGTHVIAPRYVIPWMYPDGRPRNCEACALLPSGTLLVVTKSFPHRSGPSTIYEVQSPVSGQGSTIVRAVQILPSSYGVITGMDVLGDKVVLLGLVMGGVAQAVVMHASTYALAGVAPLPASAQPEGICYSHDGTQLLVVSEADRKLLRVRLSNELCAFASPGC